MIDRLSTAILFVSLFLGTGLVSCSSEEKPQETMEGRDTTPVADTSSRSASGDNLPNELQTWFGDRYGPAVGTVKYEVTIGETTTGRTSYFADHGLREAHYLNLTEEKNAPQHITIIDSGKIIAMGPGDPKPLRATWHPDPNQTLPNFRHLTDDMRELFRLEELPSKEILGKESRGYRLQIGNSISDVWVWEGIMLYSEIKGGEGVTMPPMTIRAISVDTSSRPGKAYFTIAGSN